MDQHGTDIGLAYGVGRHTYLGEGHEEQLAVAEFEAR